MRRLQCPHLSFYAQQTRKRRNPASSLKKTELVVQGLRLTRRRVEHSTICREPAMRQETLRHLLPWQCKKNLQPFPRRAPQLRPRIGPGNALELSAREPSAQHRRRAVWTSSVRPGAFLREAARSSRQRPSSALLRKTLRHRYPMYERGSWSAPQLQGRQQFVPGADAQAACLDSRQLWSRRGPGERCRTETQTCFDPT